MQALVDFSQHQYLILSGGACCIHVSHRCLHPFAALRRLRSFPSLHLTNQSKPPTLFIAAGRSKDETLAVAKTFVTVWPPYIDAGKTIPQGRRIPKEAAGAYLFMAVG